MIEVVDLSRNFPVTIFLSGFATATFFAAGLFFFKFWKRSREPFFFFFAWACWILATERTLWLFADGISDTSKWLFIFRMAAFLLIILAVYRANKSRSVR